MVDVSLSLQLQGFIKTQHRRFAPGVGRAMMRIFASA